MAEGKRVAQRRRKRGMALAVSYLIRFGLLAALMACVCLVALGVRACVSWFAAADVPAPDVSAPNVSAQQQPFIPAGPRVEGVVTVDPGHGGIDPGCGEEGALEKDIVLPISMKLKQLLEQAGVTVVMTRQTDETVSLDRRADIANRAASDLFVSVHCNSFEGPASGMDCYYYKSEPAKQLAQTVLDRAKELGINTRQIQKNNYQVLWDTDMTAVLVETGFLTDPEECALLCDPDYQNTVAQAIAAAVLDTLQAGLA